MKPRGCAQCRKASTPGVRARSQSAVARRLKGRRIVDVKLNRGPAPPYTGRRWTYDPVLILDNGDYVAFLVTEEVDGYGIEMIYTRPPQEA